MITKKDLVKIKVALVCIFCLLSIWRMPEVEAGQDDVSHQTHISSARGPWLADNCVACHTSGTPSETDVNYDLCIPCHSPDGAYDGMDDATIGAGYNWSKDTSKIYDTNGLLKVEKRKWCVGCHDDGSCLIQDAQAPNITGLTMNGDWESPVSIVSSSVEWADNLWDGHLETGCTGGNIIFDLGDSPGTISHIRLYSVNATVQWKVYGSNDLSTWTNIVIGQSVIWAAPVWETGPQDGWNKMKLDKFIPFRYLKLNKISTWPLGSDVLKEVEFKKDIQFGYYTTGHRISCDNCHNTASVHIDGISQTYRADLNNYQNGYRLNYVEVDGEIVPPLEIPRTGCNWQEYPRTDNDFALCFACHDKNKLLGDAYSLSGLYPIVDNPDAVTTGSWGEGSSTAGYYGTNYLYGEGVTGEPTAFCTWTPDLPSAGTYKVYARWTSWTNRATNAQYIIHHSDIDTMAPPQNQTINGGTWVLLGSFAFDGSGDEHVTLTNAANNYVIADAIRFEEYVPIVDNTDAETMGTWGEGSSTAGYYGTNYLYSEGVTGEPTATCTWKPDQLDPGSYKVYARWTSWTNRATNAQYIIHHSGTDTVAPPQDQTLNGGMWVLLGSFAFDGSGDEYVSLTNEADNYVIADAVRFGEFETVPLQTNFRNDRHMDEMGNVTNEHLRHLRGRYYCGNGKDWDSDWDGVSDSPQSCPACHNVHGSPAPAMTRHGESVSTPTTADKAPMFNLQYINEDEEKDPDLSDVMESIGAQTQFYGPGPGYPKKNHTCNMCHNDQITYYRTPVSTCGDCHVEVVNTHPSHSSHFEAGLRGPSLECYDCHATSPENRHQQLFADGKSLAETTVCDTCHSPEGGYNGVNSVNGSVGAKDNWENGVYYGPDLKPGKEKWCIGCHDDVPANSKKDGTGVNAPNISGNENDLYTYGTGWGYYKTGHGLEANESYPASGGVSAGAGLECNSCHDLSLSHIDHEARSFDCSDGSDPTEYQLGYRLKLVDGSDPMEIPLPLRIWSDPEPVNSATNFRLCYSCHDSGPYLDSANMNTNLRTNGVNRHAYHLIFNQLRYPADYNYDGSYNSRMTCVNCHNVHGSTQLAMVRDGKLIGREPGLKIWYNNDDLVTYEYNKNPPDPENLPLSASTGTLWRGATSLNLCTHCHGNDNILPEYRTPFQDLQQAPQLDWSGHADYTADGINPDSGLGGSSYEFRVKYTDKNNDAPSLIQVWVDENDNSIYEASEKYDMTLWDSDGTYYIDGEVYTKSLVLSKAGDNILHYRFYGSDGLEDATGLPNSNSTVTITNNTPQLAWTGELSYTTDGVNPNSESNSNSFEFRVKYTDLDNEAPTLIEVWIDQNDNGAYEAGEKYAMSGVDGGDATYADGKLYTKALEIAYTGDGLLNYRFYATEGIDEATGVATSDSIVQVPSGSTNTAPLLSWTGETNYANDGVDPDSGAASTNFEFRITYADDDNDAPTSIQIWFDENDNTLYEEGEKYTMTEADSADTDYSDGKLYVVTLQPASAGDGSVYYHFYANDGSDAATGVPTSDQALTLIDPQEVPGEYGTIQAAINAAGNGGIVLVADGTYSEMINFNGKAISVQSRNGSATTFIDGGGSMGPLVTFGTSEGSSSVLDGFTVQNGYRSCDGGGAGLYIDGASPRIQDCTITNNSVDCSRNGGGMYITNNSSPTISSCVLTCNSGTYGGLIYMNVSSSVTINNSSISNNTSTMFGGAIYADGGSVSISDSTLNTNTSFQCGGAIYCVNDCPLTITDCTLNSNLTTSALAGGAIYCKNSSLDISDSDLDHNSSRFGGAISSTGLNAKSVVVTNCTITNNTGDNGDGGGMYLVEVTAEECILSIIHL